GALALWLAPDPGNGASRAGRHRRAQAFGGTPGPARAQGRTGLRGLGAATARQHLRRLPPRARMSIAAGALSPGAALGAPRPIVAITSGEPAGVGPELCLRIVERDWPVRLVVLGDIELMRARAAALGSSVRIVPFDAAVAAA